MSGGCLPRYRRNWFSLPGAPRNYRGKLPGDWPGEEKRRLVSRYKVCVCLENMNEPGYFTAKFVEAVVAGCIPVYRASADICDSVLQGASWADPGDSRWPADAVLQQAIEAAQSDCLQKNFRWLTESKAFAAAHATSVFQRLSQLLATEVQLQNRGA